VCAAITRQEECRRNPAGTRHVNVVQTLKLAQKLVDAGAFVVLLSTNLVFDGSRPDRRPEEPLSPKMEYSRQKAEVEHALTQWAERVAIVRITKVVHSHLPLLQKWRADLESGRPIRAFSDYVCSPVSLHQVVAGIARVAVEQRPGVWQFSGPADVSYSQLARTVAELCGAGASLIDSLPMPDGLLEHHPAHTTLDASRAGEELGMIFPPAEDVLAEYLGENKKLGSRSDGE
jgi:dTDP-4-dehydrorhamnose reductase